MTVKRALGLAARRSSSCYNDAMSSNQHVRPLGIVPPQMANYVTVPLGPGGVYLLVPAPGALVLGQVSSPIQVPTHPAPEARGQPSPPPTAPPTASDVVTGVPAELEARHRDRVLSLAERIAPRGDEESALDVVRRVRRDHGSVVLKVGEWSALTDVGERELRRAVKRAALAATTKVTGRDNGAVEIGVSALEGYLTTLDAVWGGTVGEPAWWRAVRPHRSGQPRHKHRPHPRAA